MAFEEDAVVYLNRDEAVVMIVLNGVGKRYLVQDASLGTVAKQSKSALC